MSLLIAGGKDGRSPLGGSGLVLAANAVPASPTTTVTTNPAKTLRFIASAPFCFTCEAGAACAFLVLACWTEGEAAAYGLAVRALPAQTPVCCPSAAGPP